MLRSKIKTLAFTVGPALALSPLAVVIACNNSTDSVVVEDNSDFGKYQTSVRELKAAASSTHNQITWPLEPVLASTLTPTYLPAVYSTKAYANAEAALSSPSTDWTSARPASTDVTFKTRNLWARINLAPTTTTDEASTNKPVAFDLSVTSGLQAVKVGVSALPAYQGFNLSATTLSGSAKNATITTSLSSNLAPYLKLQWKVGDLWLDEAAFKTYLQNNETLTTRLFVELLVVRAISVDAALYFFVPINTSPNTSGFSPYVVKNSTDVESNVANFLSTVASLKVEANSTHNQITWPSEPAFPDSLTPFYLPVVYSSKAYANAEAALSSPSSDWTSARPTVTDADFNARNLWARINVVTPTANAGAKPVALDLSVVSKLQTVKVGVSALPAYQGFSLSAAKLSGSVKNASITTSFSDDLAPYLKLQWQVGESWLDEAAFKTYLQNNEFRITSQFVEQLVVRAISADETLYFFVTISASPNTSDFSPYVAPSNIDFKNSVKDFLSAMEALQVQPNSTHDNLLWGPKVPGLSPTLTAYEQPEYSTSSDEGFDPNDFTDTKHWVNVLPTEVNDVIRSRRLFVRIRSVAGQSNFLRDLTITSAIQQRDRVLVNVAALRAYKEWDIKSSITNIGWTGDPINGVQLGLNFASVPPSLAQYLDLEFCFDITSTNPVWQVVNNLNYYSKQIYNRDYFATRANLANMRMRVVLSDRFSAVFNETIIETPKTTDVLTLADLANKTN